MIDIFNGGRAWRPMVYEWFNINLNLAKDIPGAPQVLIIGWLSALTVIALPFSLGKTDELLATAKLVPKFRTTFSYTVLRRRIDCFLVGGFRISLSG